MWLDRANAAILTLAAGGSALVDLLEDLNPDNRRGLTILRMFLRLYVAAATPGQDVEWNHGVMPVTRDAFTAAAVPEPGVDFQNWYLEDAAAFATDADAGPRGRDYNYDIRTGRRIPGQDTVFLHVIRNDHGANSMVYHIHTRLLLALP